MDAVDVAAVREIGDIAGRWHPDATAARKLAEVFAGSSRVHLEELGKSLAGAGATREALERLSASMGRVTVGAGVPPIAPSRYERPEFAIPDVERIDLAEVQRPQLELMQQIVEVLGRLHEHQVQSDTQAAASAAAAARRERAGLWLSGAAILVGLVAAVASVLVLLA